MLSESKSVNISHDRVFRNTKPDYVLKLPHRDRREEFKSDEEFANFRAIPGTNEQFFRSASLIDNTYGRVKTVESLVIRYSIRSALCLAETAEELAKYFKFYPCDNYIKMLYEQGHIISVHDDRSQALHKIALTQPSPHLIFCQAGKDRTGAFATSISVMAGASEHEIVRDYMLSYVNNNGLKSSDPAYRKIKRRFVQDFRRRYPNYSQTL